MQQSVNQIKNFIQFITLRLIKHPQEAELRVAMNEEEKQVRFRLILAQPDVAILIGKNGFMASSIRSLIKSVSERDGIQIHLSILSQEEYTNYLQQENNS